MKAGDKVKIKKGVSSKTHGLEDPLFVEEMDDLISKKLTVKSTDEIDVEDEDRYVSVMECEYLLHPDWLEPWESGKKTYIDEPMTTEQKTESILSEAERIVNGERQADYPDPVKNFKHIAEIASAIRKKDISPTTCCIVMIAVKLARENYKHKRDNLVDLAGYVEILHRIKEDVEV